MHKLSKLFLMVTLSCVIAPLTMIGGENSLSRISLISWDENSFSTIGENQNPNFSFRNESISAIGMNTSKIDLDVFSLSLDNDKSASDMLEMSNSRNFSSSDEYIETENDPRITDLDPESILQRIVSVESFLRSAFFIDDQLYLQARSNTHALIEDPRFEDGLGRFKTLMANELSNNELIPTLNVSSKGYWYMFLLAENRNAAKGGVLLSFRVKDVIKQGGMFFHDVGCGTEDEVEPYVITVPQGFIKIVDYKFINKSTYDRASYDQKLCNRYEALIEDEESYDANKAAFEKGLQKLKSLQPQTAEKSRQQEIRLKKARQKVSDRALKNVRRFKDL